MTQKQPAQVRDVITNLKFSPDNRHLIVAKIRYTSLFSRGLLEVWNATTRRKSKSWFTDANVRGVAVSPDNLTFASSSGTVRWWDIKTGSLLRTFPVPADHFVFSPNGRELVVDSGGVAILNVKSGRLLREKSNQQGTFTNDVAVSPDGKSIAVSHYHDGSTFTVYDFQTQNALGI